MGLTRSGYQYRNDHTSGYVVGDWQPGTDFVQRTDFQLMDFGAEFYAPQTYLTPDGRRICYGWMGTFTIPAAPQLAHDGWFGQLTVPRELHLDEQLHLHNHPIAELEKLRTKTTVIGDLKVGINETRTLVDDAPPTEITMRIDLAASSAERMGLVVHRTDAGRETYIAYDDQASRLIVDRRTTGPGNLGYRSLAVEGEASISSYSFPIEGQRGIDLLAESGDMLITNLEIHELGSIWEED